jgi:SpoIIAA-like
MPDILAGGARVFVRADRILEVESTERRKQTLADAQAIIGALRQLAAGRRVQVLIDIRATGGVDGDAQRHYNTEARTFATAVALVTSSTLGRIIANFVMAANEGVLPVRLFNDEASAVEWLKQHPPT